MNRRRLVQCVIEETMQDIGRVIMLQSVDPSLHMDLDHSKQIGDANQKLIQSLKDIEYLLAQSSLDPLDEDDLLVARDSVTLRLKDMD